MLPAGSAERQVNMLSLVRESCNHFILNKLLVLRYHARRHPHIIKFVMLIELLFVRLGLIYYGHRKM